MQLASTDTLRALMAQRGLSTTALGLRAGCSRSFIGHLHSGRKTSCTPDLARRISAGLQVPMDLLFVPDQPTTGSTNSNLQSVAAASA